MSDSHPPTEVASDRRVRKSHAAIQSAFSRLFIEKGFDGFSVGDIVGRADIARSTFYEHYASKQEVLCAVMAPILTSVADCTVSTQEPAKLMMICTHLWDNRTFANALFAEPARTALARMLANLIGARRTSLSKSSLPEALAAKALALTALGFLEEWLSGRTRCKTQEFSGALHISLYAASSALARSNS